MGFRFRRTLQLFPGVRLSVGKSGIPSVSVGVRGARVTMGRTGVTRTLGIPGTGLFHTTKIRSGVPTRRARAVNLAESIAAPVVRAGIDPARFHMTPQPVSSSKPVVRTALLIGAIVALVVGLAWSYVLVLLIVPLVVVALNLPSQGALRTAAVAQCWRDAEQELTRRRMAFNLAAERQAPLSTLESLRGLLALQRQLTLSTEEAGPATIALVHGGIEVLEFQAGAAAAGTIGVVASDRTITAPDDCYFAGACRYDKRGPNDRQGTLYLTDRRAIFVAAEGLTATSWTSVVMTARDDYTLRIQRRDRETPYAFVFASLGQAMIAEWITIRLMATKGAAAEELTPA